MATSIVQHYSKVLESSTSRIHVGMKNPPNNLCFQKILIILKKLERLLKKPFRIHEILIKDMC